MACVFLCASQSAVGAPPPSLVAVYVLVTSVTPLTSFLHQTSVVMTRREQGGRVTQVGTCPLTCGLGPASCFTPSPPSARPLPAAAARAAPIPSGSGAGEGGDRPGAAGGCAVQSAASGRQVSFRAAAGPGSVLDQPAAVMRAHLAGVRAVTSC